MRTIPFRENNPKVPLNEIKAAIALNTQKLMHLRIGLKSTQRLLDNSDRYSLLRPNITHYASYLGGEIKDCELEREGLYHLLREQRPCRSNGTGDLSNPKGTPVD
jgi:hypothetical protein